MPITTNINEGFCKGDPSSIRRGEEMLIEELSKYKQIWEEFKKEYGCIYWSGNFLLEDMEEIEQKYFPKPVTTTITIRVEASNLDDMSNALHDIRSFVSANGKSEMKIVNKKED